MEQVWSSLVPVRGKALVQSGRGSVLSRQVCVKRAPAQRRTCVCRALSKKLGNPRKTQLAELGLLVLIHEVFFGASRCKKTPEGASCCSSSSKKAKLKWYPAAPLQSVTTTP
eukprot:2331848-Amphidinium_carterae.1